MRKAWLLLRAPLLALGLLLSAASCQQAASPPKNVIVMISDGMGPSAVTLKSPMLAMWYQPLESPGTSKVHSRPAMSPRPRICRSRRMYISSTWSQVMSVL